MNSATSAVAGRDLRVTAGLFAVVAAIALALWFLIPAAGMQQQRSWTGILCAGIGLAVLVTMLQRRTPPWMYLPLLLFFILPQFSSSFYTLFHSFMHYSFVHEVFLRGLLPENPLMAGEPLRYMYGVHVLAAWVMHWLPLSPPVLFAGLDAVLLVAYALVLARIAACLDGDATFRVLAVVLALFGTDWFVDGPLYGFVADLLFQRRFGAPTALQKFTGINTNQVGMLCMAVALLAMLRLALGNGRRPASYAMFGLAAAVAAVCYQPAWVAIVATGGAAAGLAVVWPALARRREGLVLLLLLLASTLVAWPVLQSVSGGTPGDPAVQLLPGLLQLRANAVYWLLHMLAPALLLWLYRERAWQLLTTRTMPAALLLLVVAVLHAMYLVVYVRFSNEYKFLGFASAALAPLTAILLHAAWERHRRAAVAFLFLFLLPCMTDFTWVTLTQPVTDRVTGSGREIVALDRRERGLQRWIAAHTDVRAVFVDSVLTIPSIAGRQLFVGLDLGRDPGVTAGTRHNGWLIDANVFLRRIIAVDRQRLEQRERIATELLSGEGAIEPALLQALRTQAPAGRPLFVVARVAGQRERLAAAAGLRLAYTGDGIAVFEVMA